jgi:methionine synthase II (cobalamin-independent)
MKSIQNFIFSEKLEKAMDESIARAVAASEAAGLPRSYLHSYDELPEFLPQLQERNKSARSLQDRMFSAEVRQAISESIKEAVASSEAAGLPRAYVYSYDELPEFVAQLWDRNKSAE